MRSKNKGVMSYIAISEIFKDRFERNHLGKDLTPHIRVYIINSLKNPNEYAVLRHVYRRNFIFLSVYCSKDDRYKNLIRQQTISTKIKLTKKDREDIKELMETDRVDDKGTRYTIETYHKAHYFINYEDYQYDLERFTKLIMNHLFITPTKDEIGMTHAYFESLKSSDLSRQVGAVILNDDGNLLSSGCNEVPKYCGGLHWCDTKPDLRDFKCKDKNNIPISGQVKKLKQDDIVERIAIENKIDISEIKGFLDDSLEFMRAVHAEEAAICDAAKRGVPIQNCTLYCTTYPCHLCAKYIIASGIKRVVYIEPYVKSLSEKLFHGLMRDKATTKDNNIVKFVSFRGVAPKRFRYIFRKYKEDRKVDGKVVDWKIDTKAIHLSHSTPLSYYWIETLYLKILFGEFKDNLRMDFNDDIAHLLNIKSQKVFYESLIRQLGTYEIIPKN